MRGNFQLAKSEESIVFHEQILLGGTMTVSKATTKLARAVESKMRISEVPCDFPALPHSDFRGEIVFRLRELLTLEVRYILTTTEEDPIGKVLREMIEDSSLDMRHRVEIISRAALNPQIDHAAAILLARDHREIFQRLSDEILELTCQAIGFENVAALHTVH